MSITLPSDHNIDAGGFIPRADRSKNSCVRCLPGIWRNSKLGEFILPSLLPFLLEEAHGIVVAPVWNPESFYTGINRCNTVRQDFLRGQVQNKVVTVDFYSYLREVDPYRGMVDIIDHHSTYRTEELCIDRIGPLTLYVNLQSLQTGCFGKLALDDNRGTPNSLTKVQ